MLNEKIIYTDLCVVGGGMAGVSAAISAARSGIKVVLIQERPVLGGNASSENRMWICGARGKNNHETGIVEEIQLENLYRNPTKNFYIFDSILLDFAKREENLTLLLNTTCMDATVDEGDFDYGRIRKIRSVKAYQMTTQLFYRVEAKYFADCSGDSILAPLSGADFMYGRESAKDFGENTHVAEADNMVMGMSCLIQGRQTERNVKFTPSEFATTPSDSDVENRPMDIYDPSENYWYLELGGTDGSIEKAEDTKEKLRYLSLGVWNYIKNSGKYDADKWELEFLGFLPAKRESRRMKGEYIVTQKDIVSNTVFPDTVAYGGWPLDDHYPAGYYHKGIPNTDIQTPAPYCLPYRSLYSANVDNLFFAGRNISMTHAAMSSIRVMATCSLLGQAVGSAAAVATKNGIAPHGVYLNHLDELQRSLMDQDCFLPYRKREISELCKNTPIINGNESLKNGEDRPNHTYGTDACGVRVANGTTLEYKFEKPERIESVHVVFDSDLDRLTLNGRHPERITVTRANVLLDSPQMYVPKTLAKSFRLTALSDGEEVELLAEEKNIKRMYHIRPNKSVSALRLTVFENWGDSEETSVFSFDFC